MSRFSAVFIRKSTAAQTDADQRSNVKRKLDAKGIKIAAEHWYESTVSRSNVEKDEKFVQLMNLVEAGSVDCIYVESQDRFGTGNTRALYRILDFLASNDTQLFDLSKNTELTKVDDESEMLTFLGSLKSRKEREDLAERTMRTKVNRVIEHGTWPSGAPPFGFAKRCIDATGNVIFEWHPSSRSRGQHFRSKNEKLIAEGNGNERIRPKEREHFIKLIPNHNKAHVKTVRRIFELFTKVGLSRRAISAKLNEEQRLYYDEPFTHSVVSLILENPAYVGDLHYGKTKSAKFKTFNSDKMIETVTKAAKSRKRSADERIVFKNAFPGLIDRKTWDAAQAKLNSEKTRTSFSPRNPAYYLKQIFVCGHCGKNMMGRTEKSPDTGKKTVVYICSSYLQGKSNGQQTTCGPHRITHEDAEKLLVKKLKSSNILIDMTNFSSIKKRHHESLWLLNEQDEDKRLEWWDLVEEGAKQLYDYYRKTGQLKNRDLHEISICVRNLYDCGRLKVHLGAKNPASAIAKFRRAIETAESLIVAKADQKLAALNAEHKNLTRNWMKASVEMQIHLREEIERIESERKLWQERSIPVSKRIAELETQERQRDAERKKLMADWPTLESRAKGEALRRLFNTVTLFWDKKFHAASAKPARERKTNRPGRYSYHLKTNEIRWQLSTSDLTSSR